MPIRYSLFAYKQKGSGTPADAEFHARTQAACGTRHGRRRLAPPSACGRARLPAFHRGSCRRDFRPGGSASGQASRRRHRTLRTCRKRRLRSQRSTSRAGRSAGRHDARAARVRTVAVSLVITEHRSEVRRFITQSGVSLYETEEDMAHERAFLGLDFLKWNTLKLKVQSEYPFILYADISSFFYSIYTHSIPWAVLGKEQAKEWNNNDKAKLDAHWSNDFDKAVQCCQSRETFGIPVGPDTSRIIAELLMAGIDADQGFSTWLKNRTAFRLVDDLTMGFEREEHAYKALAALRTALWKFNFRLNDEKTKVLSSRNSLREKWEIEHDKFLVSDVNPRQQSDDIA
jgi:Reverse transcriptase (RNA-dependent DNA polymerase)